MKNTLITILGTSILANGAVVYQNSGTAGTYDLFDDVLGVNIGTLTITSSFSGNATSATDSVNASGVLINRLVTQGGSGGAEWDFAVSFLPGYTQSTVNSITATYGPGGLYGNGSTGSNFTITANTAGTITFDDTLIEWEDLSTAPVTALASGDSFAANTGITGTQLDNANDLEDGAAFDIAFGGTKNFSFDYLGAGAGSALDSITFLHDITTVVPEPSSAALLGLGGLALLARRKR